MTLSRSLATGIVLGVCPVFGLPLLLSGVAVVRFKLNAPLVAAVQLAVGAGTKRLQTRDSLHSLEPSHTPLPSRFPAGHYVRPSWCSAAPHNQRCERRQAGCRPA